MTEQWARLEQRQLSGNDLVGAVLELRARVETLERRCEVQLMQLSDLQDRHHRLTLQVGHLEHDLFRDDDDEPQQHCLEAMDPPEANSKPTPNDRQIRSSLLERVGRRPKPPSLKEQALAELEKVDMLWDTTEFGQETLGSLDTIRRALEALPDDRPLPSRSFS
jgi:hypothetical protein